MTVSGTAPELRDRMRRLREAGYDEVVVQITPGCESMIEAIERGWTDRDASIFLTLQEERAQVQVRLPPH